MVKIIQTDKITKGDVIKWIVKCNCLHSLQSIRAKTNKRIRIITSPKNNNPFAHIPVEKKREVLKDLLVDAPDSNSSSDKSESFNKDYQETSEEVSQIPNGTSDNPDINRNKLNLLVEVKK